MDSRASPLRLILQGMLACAALTAASGSFAAESAGKTAIPRNAEGKPEFSGFWTHETITPLERPASYGDRNVMNMQEVNAAEKFASDHRENADAPTDPKLKVQDLPKDCGYGFSGTNCGYNNFWVDRGEKVLRIKGEPRASILTQPSNGRMPAMLPEARKRMAATNAAFRKGAGPVDGPELRSLGERCILSFGSNGGPPMLPNMYNNAYQFVQTPENMVVLVEMVHDARIVRIGDKHIAGSVKKWMGDSVGRWDGDTLVVTTKNFRQDQSFRGAAENLTVTERLTRVAQDQLLYRFTIEDPTMFTAPTVAELPFMAVEASVYEYACHEGNYALPGILAAERVHRIEVRRLDD